MKIQITLVQLYIAVPGNSLHELFTLLGLLLVIAAILGLLFPVTIYAGIGVSLIRGSQSFKWLSLPLLRLKTVTRLPDMYFEVGALIWQEID